MAENKGGAGAAPQGWDKADTWTPGGDGTLVENTGREGQRDSTADRDPTNDRAQDAEWRKAAAEDRGAAIDANQEQNVKPEWAREGADYLAKNGPEAFDRMASQAYGVEKPQQQETTQEKVATAVKDVREGNVGVTKAMGEIQQKLDDREKDRGRGKEMEGRGR